MVRCASQPVRSAARTRRAIRLDLHVKNVTNRSVFLTSVIDRQTIYPRHVARVALVFLLVAGWLATTALSAPAPRQRVVLADPDPELHHAMQQALAPWHLQVVIEEPPPTDTTMAQQRADADTARFVVWRDGKQLVVYDRELQSTERRDSQSGVLDPPSAAAAALTIKTMMRLPPPPDPPIEPLPTAANAGRGIEVRFQAGLATQISRGDSTNLSARFSGAAEIRPWPADGWGFGLAGDGGTSPNISRASFKGTWSEWAVLGFASWTYTRDMWELEPHVGFGVQRSVVEGIEMSSAARTATATLPIVRGGMWGRRRWTRWTVGAVLEIDGIFDAPTYTKTDSPATIFQIPAFAVQLGATIAVDL